jgi:hypothetical protein
MVKGTKSFISIEGAIIMWEYLIARLTVLITFSFGTLLVVLYPIINKENRIFAWISLIVGALIIIILLYYVVGSPAYRGQIFK